MKILHVFSMKSCYVATILLFFCFQTACQENELEPDSNISVSMSETGGNKQMLYDRIRTGMGVNADPGTMKLLHEALSYSEDSIAMVLKQLPPQTKASTIPTTYNWYVSSSTGSDSNAGTTLAKPFKTIQKAIDMASEGQVIKIADGTYTPINIYYKNIILVGDVSYPERVKIEGNASTYAASLNGSPELHGMTIWKGKGISLASGFPKFSHLFITQCTEVLHARNSFSFSMDNSLIWNNDSGSGTLMSFNPYDRSTQYLINTTITDNKGSKMIYMGGTGIKQSTTPSYCDLRVYNTILYNNYISTQISRDVIYSNCIVASYANIRNKFSFQGKGNEFSTQVLDESPSFIMTYNDYRLHNNSRMIDAGDPSIIDRMPPGKGSSRSDLGAYGGDSRLSNYNVLPY